VENCLFDGFSHTGLFFVRTGDTSSPQVQIIGSTFRKNLIGALAANVGPASLGPVLMAIANSSFTDSGSIGVDGGSNAQITVADSVFAGNGNGVVASGFANQPAQVSLDRCTISRNIYGVRAGSTTDQNIRGTVRAANCLITGNDTGVFNATDGITLSRATGGGSLTNTVSGNTTNGSFSGTFTAK
jgi:hypothetical protein